MMTNNINEELTKKMNNAKKWLIAAGIFTGINVVSGIVMLAGGALLGLIPCAVGACVFSSTAIVNNHTLKKAKKEIEQLKKQNCQTLFEYDKEQDVELGATTEGKNLLVKTKETTSIEEEKNDEINL